uniref:DNA-binding protein S1FA n=1 Tax=Solanum tuberosum TaxID=4113 RepID=M0ZNF9_SOLTU
MYAQKTLPPKKKKPVSKKKMKKERLKQEPFPPIVFLLIMSEFLGRFVLPAPFLGWIIGIQEYGLAVNEVSENHGG